MAPQKRARRDEDDELIALESATSSLRPEAVSSLSDLVTHCAVREDYN
jgi:hypothetical protein